MSVAVLDLDDVRTRGAQTRMFHSPVGSLELEAGPGGIRAIRWPFDDQCAPHLDPARRDRAARAGARPELGPAEVAECDRHLDRLVDQLTEYFLGSRMEFDLELAPDGTLFQRDAWQVLRTIPFGQTITYGHQARALGDPRRARAVGAANGRNPIPIVVPCHRVVGAAGQLTGFAAGLDRKSWLLEHERKVLLGDGPARTDRYPSED